MTEPQRIAGMVWYRLEDYDAARAIMEDRAKLPSTYSVWRMSAEQAEKKMGRLGWTTIRAYIQPAEFAAWCSRRGLNIDAKARNEYADLIAKEAASGLN